MSKEDERRQLYIEIADAMNDVYHNARMMHYEPPKNSEYDERFFQSGVFEELLQMWIDRELLYLNTDDSRCDGWKNFMRAEFGEFNLFGKYSSTFTNEKLFDFLQGGRVSAGSVQTYYGWMRLDDLKRMLRGLYMTTEYAEKSMKRFYKLLYAGKL